jgi:hypothetical protein
LAILVVMMSCQAVYVEDGEVKLSIFPSFSNSKLYIGTWPVNIHILGRGMLLAGWVGWVGLGWLAIGHDMHGLRLGLGRFRAG